MRKIDLFVISIITVLVVSVVAGLSFGINSLRPRNVEDQFMILVSNYDQYKNIAEYRPILDLDQEIKDASVIEQFSSQSNGNVIVLVSRFKSKSVEVWSPKLMADVFMNSKANKKRWNNE